jgi:hypothetical protein
MERRIDDVEAVDVRWAPERSFAVGFLLGLLIWVLFIGSPVAQHAMEIRPAAAPKVVPLSISWILLGALFAGLTVLVTYSYPPRLRIGRDGVELAARGCEAVLLPWDAVRGAQFRGRGLFLTLDIITSEPDRAVPGRRGGRRPRRRRRGGQVSFVVDAGLLRRGRAAIGAELQRHGCPTAP